MIRPRAETGSLQRMCSAPSFLLPEFPWRRFGPAGPCGAVRSLSGLLSSLQSFVEERRLRAPFIITCVGSVTKATLRLAKATAEDTNHVMNLSGRFEIVSLVGTLGPPPTSHLPVGCRGSDGRRSRARRPGDIHHSRGWGARRSTCSSPERWTSPRGSLSW
ncbi:hypothetical protein INR49_021873 [Caranx melampygus]|nr:hypothetical protein INR49_021873 [Caranx melampygus]